MSFHRNLNAQDLHAPSILNVENAATSPINVGDVLIITGFNPLNKKTKVRLASEGIVVENDDRLLGISKSSMPSLNSVGRMDALGIIENLTVLLTPTAGETDLEPLEVGNSVFVPLTGTNKGVVTSGNEDLGIPFGLILEVINTTTAHVFLLGLTTNTSGATGTTKKAKLNFDTTNFDRMTEPGEAIGKLSYNVGTTDFIAQWYEVESGVARVINVDWTMIGSFDDNDAALEVRLRGDLPSFTGYVEIIY